MSQGKRYNFTFGALKEQNPEAFQKSVIRGGYQSQQPPDPDWLHCDVTDFLRYLEQLDQEREVKDE